MSIQVSGISKLYGSQEALKDINFTINTGEVVGFLGPNGAGKSTMMKILTCYIPPTTGKATVGDFDIATQTLEVRKRVGYLPEHNPLYLDMYVKEYLHFVGGIYHLKNLNEKVKNIIELVGLTKEQHKQIKALSKGYRQRVGLAQALIHDPEVLILDEPTSGLDPVQLKEIRALIKKVGETKTVILSTHIMQEVEAICNRVIFIKDGEIIEDSTVNKIISSSKNKLLVQVEFNGKIQEDLLKKLKGVEKVQHMGGFKWRISADPEANLQPRLFQLAVKHNLSVIELQTKEQNLESIFLELMDKPGK